MHPIWVRETTCDRRIPWGDDFNGNAWRNLTTGEYRYVAVGHTPAFASTEREP